MKPENKVKEKVRDLVKGLTPYSLTVTTGGMGESGHPDRVACIQSHAVGIECKATARDEPTPLQQKRLRDMRAAGGFTFVVDANNFDSFAVLLLSLFSPGLGAANREARYSQALSLLTTPYWR